MFTKNRLIKRILLLIICVVLTACAPQIGSPAITPLPATATPLSAVITTIVPMVVSDATMSRLRLANLVSDSASTDMYVDGKIALLGNRQSELTKVPVGFISGFLYVEPGKHNVAIVPAGKDLSSAMIALDVTL